MPLRLISAPEADMFDPQHLIRTHIQHMPAYEPILPFEVLSQQLNRPPERIVKLDANENPYGVLPAVSQALAAMPFAHIYPDPESRALRSAIASHHGVPVDNILAGAGADELIDLILRLVIEPGDKLINCPPTFGMYAFDADLNAARVIQVPRRPDFSLDIASLEKAILEHHPKLIFLASPNNPDGSLTPRAIVESLLDLPVLVVLDEAYVEFAGPGASLLAEAPTRQNLVVLRTFSKWAGLAGLRVGYGAFPSALMPHLWKIKQPYMVSVAASTAAILSLQHAEQLSEIGGKIIAERGRLSAELEKLGWLRPYPSQANYVLCRVVGRDALDLKRKLASHGILVRYFNKPGLQDHIRISIGKPEHTDQLIQALKEME
jgi:histidinol-phosphate aminotransferase